MTRALLFWLLYAASSVALADHQPVQAELGQEVAWTSEAVPLILALYSADPFGSTPVFDFPEVPQTAIVKVGSAVVGTEQIDGVSYYTQRHEFAIYTQRIGEFVLPPITVRFSSRENLSSPPVPITSQTPELRFRSRRPPGTEDLGVVVVVRDLEATQSWQPASEQVLQAGDVLERTISVRAAGTTAMMLPSITSEAPSGVRVYPSTPVIEDRTERGEMSALRTDTIRYQFERPGNFEIPDLELAWWNPESHQLQTKTLSGRSIQVAGSAATPKKESATIFSWWSLSVLVALGLTGWLAFRPVSRLFFEWQARRNLPEVASARRLLSACRADDAAAAYRALLAWQRAGQQDRGGIVDDSPPSADLQQAASELSGYLYEGSRHEVSWSGQHLATAFQQVRNQRQSIPTRPALAAKLPALNPTNPVA